MRPWRGLDVAAQGSRLAWLLRFDALVLGALAVVLAPQLGLPLPQWSRGALPGLLAGMIAGSAIPWTTWFHRAHCLALDHGLVPRSASHWAAYSWWLPVANMWWPFTFARALWRFYGCRGPAGRDRWTGHMVPTAMHALAILAAACWIAAAAAPATAKAVFVVAAAALTAGACVCLASFAVRLSAQQGAFAAPAAGSAA